MFASPVEEWTLAGSPRMHASLEPRSGGNCDDFELLFCMSSRRSQWPWRQHFTTQPTRRPGPRTTPHGDRRTQAPSATNFPTKIEVPARGSRPPCLGEPREKQDKVQQRTMEQIADDVPMLTASGQSCAANGGPVGGSACSL